MEVTVAPAPPCPAATVAAPRGDGVDPDLLDRLWAPASPRPTVDAGLAGGLRAWLEDGVAARLPTRGAPGAPALPAAAPSAGPRMRPGTPRGMRPADLRSWLTRLLFRMVVTDGAPGRPFEEALRAVSVTERGPELLDAVRLLRSADRAALRASVRDRAATMAAQWRPVPAAWLPRTGERLRVPLGGGAVTLTASADLVLGRPSDGCASVCLVRVLDEPDGDRRRADTAGDGGDDDDDGLGRAGRACRALALAETLRSGAAPWRVAAYEPGAGRLHCQDVDTELLVAAVHDALRALEPR